MSKDPAPVVDPGGMTMMKNRREVWFYRELRAIHDAIELMSTVQDWRIQRLVHMYHDRAKVILLPYPSVYFHDERQVLQTSDAGERDEDYVTVTPSFLVERHFRGYRHVHSDFAYDQDQDIVFLPPSSFYTSFWYAVGFAHELNHAWDTYSGRIDRDTEKFDDDWTSVRMEGEVRSHAIEDVLINELTRGAFLEEIRTFVANMPDESGLLSSMEQADLSVLSTQLNLLFPKSRSGFETGQREMCYAIAAGVIRADRLALGPQGRWVAYASQQ